MTRQCHLVERRFYIIYRYHILYDRKEGDEGQCWRVMFHSSSFTLTYRNLFLFAWTVGHRSLFLSFYNALCLNVPHTQTRPALNKKKGMDVCKSIYLWLYLRRTLLMDANHSNPTIHANLIIYNLDFLIVLTTSWMASNRVTERWMSRCARGTFLSSQARRAREDDSAWIIDFRWITLSFYIAGRSVSGFAEFHPTSLV